jgi:hypothetical protein
VWVIKSIQVSKLLEVLAWLGEVQTVMENCSMEFRHADYPIKLNQIGMPEPQSMTIQSESTDPLTEVLNIARYPYAIAVNANDDKLSSRNFQSSNRTS